MRSFLAALSLVALAALSGCSGKPGPISGGQTPAAPPAAKSLLVAEVTDTGGIDDKSFNASAWAGLQRAQKDLGVQAKYVESHEQTDYEGNLSLLAEQSCALVFAVGYLMEDALGKVGPSHPNTKFAI